MAVADILVCALRRDPFYPLLRHCHCHFGNRFYIVIILIIFKLHSFRPAVIQAEPEKFYRLTYQHSNNRSQQRTEDRKVGIIHKIPTSRISTSIMTPAIIAMVQE